MDLKSYFPNLNKTIKNGYLLLIPHPSFWKINKQKLKILENIDFAELCITSLAEIKFHDTDEIDVQTNKAQGNKCPVCWKISSTPCERHKL